MKSNEIRKEFFEFFKNKNHRIVPSAPVVPFDDPTLLFTNAGMNQFKDVFLGKGTRPYTRAADTQKCIRVSGKHNDLEEVGRDTYHHTFFEMLGNWSFGDYYKKEAIAWAWELLTDVYKLPKERLWATVFRTDDEAFEIWKSKTDINPSHILRFDEKDNFWEMGETGPCGPCSEIHINLSDDLENASLVNAGVPECIEIWNLVFIQYFRDESGALSDLPAKHIDTGMGFERLTAVLQGKSSNYDTDIFMPIINKIAETSGIEYEDAERGTAMRVIADHIRTLTFAIADGAIPGNEGRGYVLRRILRRASRFGRKLNFTEPFLFNLVDTVVEIMGGTFPEIVQNRKNVRRIIEAEEKSFNLTLDRGLDLFEKVVERVKNSGGTIISGEDVFKLYDTFGFPSDLTNIMAEEIGLSIDNKKFESLMSEQRRKSRNSTKNKIAGANNLEEDLSELKLDEIAETVFTGYDSLKEQAAVVNSFRKENEIILALDKSPFYAESGGQASDKGYIEFEEKKFSVKDLKKVNGRILHILENEAGAVIPKGAEVTAVVDEKNRLAIMRNHSATHLLHAALRKVLGSHVQQSGSYVGPDRLRFDYSHYKKPSEEELSEIEDLINEKILMNIKLNHHRSIPFDEAKKMGALMFFGDKYGDSVNVVQFGDFSMEFCGGTHVKNSSQIGLFKIVSESSIASGIRRIEAVTGAGVAEYIRALQEKIKSSELNAKMISDEKRKLEKELNEFKLQAKLGGIDSIIDSPEEIGGIKIYKGRVNASNMDELKSMGDELRGRIASGVGLLIAEVGGKVQMVCVVSDDLLSGKKLNAGRLVGQAAKIVGGGGGGRPHLATAGGKDVSRIDGALDKFNLIVEESLN